MKLKKTIVELSKKYDTDKRMNDGIRCYNGVLGHNYAIHYDNHLKSHEVKNMLEIGISWGASIKMWDEYFNGSVNIIGVDINEKRFKKEQIENNKIKIFIGDQGNENFLNTFKEISFDLIIDDGSHRMKDQQTSFKVLFNFLRKGGLYIIEDLHTSNHSSFFDSKPETTTKELLKHLQIKKEYLSKYISNIEYQKLLENIEIVEFFENETISFIRKKND